jgi:hypothetical protein
MKSFQFPKASLGSEEDIFLICGEKNHGNTFIGILWRLMYDIPHLRCWTKKYLMYYRMTYDAFNNLILSLTSHLQIILFESF